MLQYMKDITGIVGDIATALAVAFAAWQLWELNRRNKIESHLNLIESEREIWIAALQVPELSETVVTEVWGISDPRNAKRNIFVAIFLDNCEHIYLRHQYKLIDERTWEAVEGYIKRLVAVPSIQAALSDIEGDYDPEFIRYLRTNTIDISQGIAK
jgi:hypothetical protein